jgi:PAS domain S-box-containing protein
LRKGRIVVLYGPQPARLSRRLDWRSGLSAIEQCSTNRELVIDCADASEKARLSALASYKILDTPHEQAFDDLARLASIVCEAPIALVSLVDEDRQWFKANVGLEGVSETPRSHAFCAYTIQNAESLVVPDATKDERFLRNVLVTGPPFIRFYAGAPLLLGSDIRLGSLCVIDTVARPGGLTEMQSQSLEALARCVVAQIELRRELRDRQKAESQLRESEARLRLACEAAGIGAWETDLATGRPFLSPDSLAMFEITAQQSMQLDSTEAWANLIHPDDRERALTAARKAALSGELYDMTFRVPRKEGGERWIQGIGRTQSGGDGRPSKLVGINIDVTSAKEAELKLRQSQESLSLALDVGRMATFDWNVNGGDAHWSDGHFTLLGYEIGEVEPGYEAWAARVFPDDLAQTEARLRHAQETGEEYRAEYRVVLPDGSRVWIEGWGRYFTGLDGTPARMIGIIQDVTARKSAELTAKRAEADVLRVSRLSAMGAMASTLAHELNQPLTAANNYLNTATVLLSQDKVEPEAVLGALARTQTQTKRVDDIIRRMRGFTLRGEISARREPVAELVATVLASLRRRLQEASISVRTSGLQDVGGAMVDRVQIEQVLGNLLRNALDVLVDTDVAERWIEVSASRIGGKIEIRVSDNGPGLPPDMVESVFDLFQSSKEDGMGLGLPLCRTIVNAHGGRIWAESKPGFGALFVLELPAVD